MYQAEAIAYAISPSNSPDAEFEDDEAHEAVDSRLGGKWRDELIEKYVPPVSRAKVMGHCRVCGGEIHLCESFRYTGWTRKVLCSDGKVRTTGMLCRRHWWEG
uniref:Uncharacterized protein n=1 Tax=viral metagenome TaxID=1070528 RepID=A0A6M3L175_9ZZZZ